MYIEFKSLLFKSQLDIIFSIKNVDMLSPNITNIHKYSVAFIEKNNWKYLFYNKYNNDYINTLSLTLSFSLSLSLSLSVYIYIYIYMSVCVSGTEGTWKVLSLTRKDIFIVVFRKL